MIGMTIGCFARPIVLVSCFITTATQACCETYENVPLHCATGSTPINVRDFGYPALEGQTMVGEVVYEAEISGGYATVIEDALVADGCKTVIDSGAIDAGYETVVDDVFTYEAEPQTMVPVEFMHEAPVDETGLCGGCYADQIMEDTTFVSDEIIWEDSEPAPAFSIVDPVVYDAASEEVSTQDSGTSFDTEADADPDTDPQHEVDDDELNNA